MHVLKFVKNRTAGPEYTRMTFGSLVKFCFCMGYEMALVLLIAQHRDKTDIEKYVLCENVVRRKACERRCSDVMYFSGGVT